ncbi:MAG: tol-pal system protein YbgF [Polyangiales bacterium]
MDSRDAQGVAHRVSSITMRIRTQRVGLVASLAWAAGCASTTAQRPSPTTESTGALVALKARQLEQTQRIEELEARLLLLEADARAARSRDDAREQPEDKPRPPSVEERTTAAARSVSDVARGAEGEDDIDDKRPRPRLRLHGQRATDAQISWPAVPVGETLPVAPLPAPRARERLRAAPAAPSDGTGDATQYRVALRLLRERRFDEAWTAFGTFLAEHPQHGLASNALYWRGEAQYAKRDFDSARSEFEALVARYPQGEKAADALFKLALCFRQLGAEDRAQSVFRRLREEYPNSQAANVAAREGST